MNIWLILGGITAAVLALFFLVFSFFSILEKEKTAAWRSLLAFILILSVNFVLLMFKAPLRNWLFGGFFWLFLGIVLVIFLVPPSRRTTEIVAPQEKIDERDVIFTRFDYEQGAEIFKQYYKKNPQFKAVDDEIRKIPDIFSPYHLEKKPEHFSLAEAEFDFLEHQLTQVDGRIDKQKWASTPLQNTRMIKKSLDYLGSQSSGVCLLDQAYVYSHVGRGPEPYGKEVDLHHKFAVVFAVEMDTAMIAAAPKAPVIIETGKKYVEAARISIILAQFIRHLGYSARAHIAGSNYQAVLPPLGWKAGLGELGRLGILITHKFGPRARLGLVTTDLPLIPDKPKTSGIQDFCQKCQKCARNCPSQAIPYGDKTQENGVLKWVLNRELCYRFWRKAGTDCAVCIFVCPFSKPHNIFHSLIRKMTEKSSVFQTLSIWGDDIFYGRFPPRRKLPLD
ncbi:MAG: 4Fe-4S dicluster domain-containing protein [Candidatus Aminicenantes bacterium]